MNRVDGSAASRQSSAPSITRRRCRWWILAALAGVLSGCTAGTAPARQSVSAPPLSLRPPPTTAAFLNSVGVNIHGSYIDTSYGNAARVVAGLQYLGVKHVRDGYRKNRPDVEALWNRLGGEGIRLDVIAGDPLRRSGTDTPAGAVPSIAARLSGVVDAIEGANELDNGSDPAWASILGPSQLQLANAVRSEPKLAGVAVVGPSLTNVDDMGKLGDLSAAIDVLNVHPYSGGEVPDRNLPGNLDHVSVMAPGRPVMATEAGYHNAVNDALDQPGVPVEVAASYIPRLLADCFSAGVTRTYLYELLDETGNPARSRAQDNFGLFYVDGRPKPAARQVRTLLSLLAHRGAFDGAAPLHYTLTPSAPGSSLRSLVLMGPDGGNVLMLWRDVSLYDTRTRRLLTVRPLPVTIGMESRTRVVVQSVAASRPGFSGTVKRLTIPVSGDLVVVKVGN